MNDYNVHPFYRRISTCGANLSSSSTLPKPSEVDGAFSSIPWGIHNVHAVVCKAQFLNFIHPKLAAGASSWQLEKFKKGCETLQQCQHPSIVAFLGILEDSYLKQPIVLMELMSQCLKELLGQKKIDFPLHLQLDICSDIAQGLEYLHAKKIIHGNMTALKNSLTMATARNTDFEERVEAATKKFAEVKNCIREISNAQRSMK